MKKFTKNERGTFRYWICHLLAFNLVAIMSGHWRFRYLFHDLEKPFLLLLWKDYARVQTWHRNHSKHHFEYYLTHYTADFSAMAIDWECSHLTKEGKKRNCKEELEIVLQKCPDSEKHIFKATMEHVIAKLGF